MGKNVEEAAVVTDCTKLLIVLFQDENGFSSSQIAKSLGKSEDFIRKASRDLKISGEEVKIREKLVNHNGHYAVKMRGKELKR
jgi:biotin operon repressor